MNTIQESAFELEKPVASSAMKREGKTTHPCMLCEALANSVRERIFSHELKPGMPIDELLLASRYGVTRASLREALNALVGEELVEFRGHYVVARLTQYDLGEIFEMLEMLENFAIRRAAIATVRIPEGEGFYRNLLNASQNRYLLDLVDRLFVKLRLALGQFLDAPEMQPSPAFQSALNGMIAEGAANEALQLMADYGVQRYDKAMSLLVLLALSFDEENTRQGHKATFPQKPDEAEQIDDVAEGFRAGAV